MFQNVMNSLIDILKLVNYALKFKERIDWIIVICDYVPEKVDKFFILPTKNNLLKKNIP